MRDLFYRLENSFEHSTLKFEHVGDYYKVSLMYRSQVFVVRCRLNEFHLLNQRWRVDVVKVLMP